MLFLHGNKQWAKKIKGKLHYFGKDYEQAVAEFKKRFPDHPQVVGGEPRRGRPKGTKVLRDKSTKVKPEKPENSPLYAHNNGQWAATVRGQTVYFGPWDDHTSALAEYHEMSRHVGRGGDPFAPTTVGALLQLFLSEQKGRHKEGKIRTRTLNDLLRHCPVFETHFGKHTRIQALTLKAMKDFRESLNDGVNGSLNAIGVSIRVRLLRQMLKWAEEKKYIDRALWRESVTMPTARQVRDAKEVTASKTMPLATGQALLQCENPMMKVAHYFGANCAFEPHDCGEVKWRHLEIGHVSWLNFPRPKTGCPRRCPLWPETVEAIKAWKSVRPKGNDELVLVSRNGSPVAGTGSASTRVGGINASSIVSRQTDRQLRALALKEPGVCYMGWRHVAQTIGETASPLGTKGIMGHVPAKSDMSSEYRVDIAPEILFSVVKVLREYWIDGVSPFSGHELSWE